MASWNDLSEAAGKLTRAAWYLMETHGWAKSSVEDAAAAGMLLGLAYTIRPQVVKIDERG